MSDKDIVLIWKGTEYTVKEANTMKLGAIVEEIVTISQLSNPDGPPLFRCAMAMGAALRFAGCKVSDREIHTQLFVPGNAAMAMMETLNVLLSIMLPPDLVLDYLKRTKQDEPQPKKKPNRKS